MGARIPPLIPEGKSMSHEGINKLRPRGRGIWAVGGGLGFTYPSEYESRYSTVSEIMLHQLDEALVGMNSWQCEYCDKPNQNVDRCTECGAPRPPEKQSEPEPKRKNWWNSDNPKWEKDLWNWFLGEKDKIARKYAVLDSAGNFEMADEAYTFKNKRRQRKFLNEVEELRDRYLDRRRLKQRGLVEPDPDLYNVVGG